MLKLFKIDLLFSTFVTMVFIFLNPFDSVIEEAPENQQQLDWLILSKYETEIQFHLVDTDPGRISVNSDHDFIFIKLKTKQINLIYSVQVHCTLIIYMLWR